MPAILEVFCSLHGASLLRFFSLLPFQQGHEATQFNLGFAYANGNGVPQDYVSAHMWYNLAS